MLRDLTSSESLKKSSFKKKKFILFLTKILLNLFKTPLTRPNTTDAYMLLFTVQTQPAGKK